MMRQISFIITLLFITMNSFGQNDVIIDNTQYMAKYLYTYQEDSVNQDKEKTDEMTLYIGHKHSSFEHSGRFFRDSLRRDVRKQAKPDAAIFDSFAKSGKVRSGGHFTNYRIIKEKNCDTVILSESVAIAREKIKVSERMRLSWILISNADTTISNYPCKKATTSFGNRDYKVWYTVDIPINDGPYKFKGLPGLIVKVEDTQSQHIFELISFQKVNYSKPIYFDINQYKEVDMRAYYRLKRWQQIIWSEQLMVKAI